MIEKTIVPKKKAVKVTFRLPADVAETGIAIVGDFNNWDDKKDLMKRDKKNGHWGKTLTFDLGSEVQFRYLIDGSLWVNDGDADRYEANEFGTENAVIVV